MIKKLLFAVFVLALFSAALPVLAQIDCTAADGHCTYTPLEPIPDAGLGNTINFASYLSSVFKVLISFGGLFAVVMLVIAGIGYMLSESALDIDKAKHRAQAALWGLLLLTGCWLILYTINPNLIKFDLSSISKILPTSSTASGGATTAEGAQVTYNNTTMTLSNARSQCVASDPSKHLSCVPQNGNTVCTCQ